MVSKSLCTQLSLLLMAASILFILSPALATYRKPPFNGSIFGKRSGNLVNGEYDSSASKALSAMCEIANEACQQWFPPQEK
ncbi:FMRFamide-related neuropeptides [Euwallacea fornicatus]|uniref:FMRFamide-related neuropeptides n=1 Tax=Euwallacea fornicatus TaxID=995702 RepID=UPI00279B3842|nr:putative FMRFamide-like neuropeptide [Euwallacea interjectus]